MKVLIMFLLAGLCAAASRMIIDTEIPIMKTSRHEISVGIQYDGHPKYFRESVGQGTIRYTRRF